MKFYHGVLPSAYRYSYSLWLVERGFSFGEFLIFKRATSQNNLAEDKALELVNVFQGFIKICLGIRCREGREEISHSVGKQ
jgi:hypothetical protein